MRRILLVLIVAVFMASCGNNAKKNVSEKQKEKTAVNSDKGKTASNLVSGENVIESYANGKPRLVLTVEQHDGKDVTVYQKGYFENGKISNEGPILNGKRSGEWKNYYKTGELWNVVYFKDDLADSTTVAYFQNGKIRYEGQYVKGQKSGTWKLFTEEGKLKELKNYVLK